MRMVRWIFRLRRVGLSLGALCAAGATFAHHSYAMFNQVAPVLIQGSLAKLEWINPHSAIWIYAKKPGKPGQYDIWAFEAASPGLMQRYGFKKDSVKVGEKIVVQYFPLRSGLKGGQFIRLFRADGAEFIADPHAVGVKPVLEKGRPDLRAFGIKGTGK
jgi:hypothetical protein